MRFGCNDASARRCSALTQHRADGEAEAKAIVALRAEVDALREDVRQLTALVARPALDPGGGISTGVAAAIYGVDKTWMRKLVVRHKLGVVSGRRWRIDPHAFAALVAANKPECLPELRRRLPSASKRVSGASRGATG